MKSKLLIIVLLVISSIGCMKRDASCKGQMETQRLCMFAAFDEHGKCKTNDCKDSSLQKLLGCGLLVSKKCKGGKRGK